jgi:hypothetical protein
MSTCTDPFAGGWRSSTALSEDVSPDVIARLAETMEADVSRRAMHAINSTSRFLSVTSIPICRRQLIRSSPHPSDALACDSGHRHQSKLLRSLCLLSFAPRIDLMTTADGPSAEKLSRRVESEESSALGSMPKRCISDLKQSALTCSECVDYDLRIDASRIDSLFS